ncbi:glycosyltransferase family 4 protein [Agromyces bauzanensis]
MTARPLRIAILGLHYSPEPTGNAPYTASLAAGLRRHGHDVRVITAHPHYPEWRVRDGYGEWRRSEMIGGVPVTRLSHYVPTRPSGVRRLLSELSFGARLLVAHWGSPDVVLLVSPALFSSALAGARLRLSRRRPVHAVWVQDLYTLGVVETGQGGGALARFMRAVESSTLRAARGVAVIHDRFRDYVVDELGVEHPRVEVIRNWSHLQPVTDVDRAAVRARLGWGDETVVLHAGNIGVKQGLENVVDAARIADVDDAPVRFVILGDGNRRASVKAAARGIRSVQFIDPLPDGEFEQVLASADVLLVNERPGVAEMSVPSKLTTYFSTGLPVIAATDAGSVTSGEIATSGGGVRVDAGQPQELLDAVLAMRSDPAGRAAYGAAGRQFRETALGADSAIERYAAWLADLAQQGGRAALTVESARRR